MIRLDYRVTYLDRWVDGVRSIICHSEADALRLLCHWNRPDCSHGSWQYRPVAVTDRFAFYLPGTAIYHENGITYWHITRD